MGGTLELKVAEILVKDLSSYRAFVLTLFLFDRMTKNSVFKRLKELSYNIATDLYNIPAMFLRDRAECITPAEAQLINVHRRGEGDVRSQECRVMS